MPDDEKKSSNGGMIHISEDVIAELARKTIQGIPNIKTAGLASKFSIGRKSGGIRVSVEHSQGSISVDAYVLVKYGQRIPDLAWDVQEKIKDNLERYTGYDVKAVNVNVQGIYTNSADNIQMNIELSPPSSSDEEAD
ncbi:MAG: Asp23/Gls24 family envelope stress response protein [Synergistaceae bacterium]|nr:Asp23/Gls24 family envelope stress response protein [Synergistaceae bacterium]